MDYFAILFACCALMFFCAYTGSVAKAQYTPELATYFDIEYEIVVKVDKNEKPDKVEKDDLVAVGGTITVGGEKGVKYTRKLETTAEAKKDYEDYIELTEDYVKEDEDTELKFEKVDAATLTAQGLTGIVDTSFYFTAKVNRLISPEADIILDKTGKYAKSLETFSKNNINGAATFNCCMCFICIIMAVASFNNMGTRQAMAASNRMQSLKTGGKWGNVGFGQMAMAAGKGIMSQGIGGRRTYMG